MIDKIKPYWRYLKYLLKHKKNVFSICWKKKMYIHAFTHDLSKFLPSEFIPYAQYFYGDKMAYQGKFNKAVNLHYKRNKHHWQHWVGRIMPQQYVQQMVCDWKAMSNIFGDTVRDYYNKNKDDINIHKHSRDLLEILIMQEKG